MPTHYDGVFLIRETLGLALYLGLGWLGLGSEIALGRRHGFRFVAPVVWGGLAYTLGAVADFARRPVLLPGVIGPHEVMHSGVLIGMREKLTAMITSWDGIRW